MHRLLSLFLALISSSIYSQNLVPNPGFELYENCPTAVKQLEYASPWQRANAGSPEFFHNCGFTSEITPYEGEGMAGAIFLDVLRSGVEYIQTPLIDSLQKGVQYCFEAKILASPDNYRMINRIGVVISKNALKTPNWEPFIRHPQLFSEEIFDDAVNWQSLSGEYRAKGGESFLTIGNFFESYYLEGSSNPTGKTKYSYYYIDNVNLWQKQGSCKSRVIQKPVEPAKTTIRSEETPQNHTVYFEKDESLLSLVETQRLDSFLLAIKNYNIKLLRLEGHTDSDASIEYNVELSKSRAVEVKSYIEKNAEVSTILFWNGESKPLNSNLNKQEKALNRRVEISIVNP